MPTDQLLVMGRSLLRGGVNPCVRRCFVERPGPSGLSGTPSWVCPLLAGGAVRGSAVGGSDEAAAGARSAGLRRAVVRRHLSPFGESPALRGPRAVPARAGWRSVVRSAWVDLGVTGSAVLFPSSVVLDKTRLSGTNLWRGVPPLTRGGGCRLVAGLREPGLSSCAAVPLFVVVGPMRMWVWSAFPHAARGHRRVA